MTEFAYRAPMRSRRDDVPDGVAVERALNRGLCGFGGRLASPPLSLEQAVTAAVTQYDERLAQRIERFAAAPNRAFVWTRDVDGYLWLGRIAGPWLYDDHPDAAAVDLVHVRPCEWLSEPVSEDRVPPAVLATFARGGRNWQRINVPDAAALSAREWDRLS